ncbi:MAG: dTDP-4-dehydrorhamnose reductase [Planctomycetes bacterium GWC2_45_44]|nr:MAG: dTDP-4-dehydrorhamnose reductase [Planctomycetes bacterium GWC2_45_44]
MDNKIVLLGGRGMLGTEVAELFSDADIKVFDLPDFDITNENHLSSVLTDCDIVINCSAFTDVEKAESQQDMAFKVNAKAVGSLAKIAHQKNIYVIHISTDFVFDGNKAGTYAETDLPKPINVYGQSKLAGEKLLAQYHNFYSIIRLQWTYGKNGNNFISKLISLSKQKSILKVVNDQFGSPTSTKETAKVIKEFVAKKPSGLFHYAAAGRASRYDIAKFAFEKLKIKTELVACKTSEFKTAAQRPLNSCFCCDKMQAVLAEPIEPWQNPLGKFLETT